MYKDYFGLLEMPFRILPDPIYLWESEQHKEAKEKILYYVRLSQGPIYLIAPTGTGKSSIAKRIKLDLNADSTKKVVYVMAPELPTTNAFLRFVMDEFGIKTDRAYAKNLRLFEQFLKDEFKNGSSPILLIDEAQNMNGQMLRLIQHLFNFSTDKEFLIQIALFAQPELQKKLNRLPSLKSRLMAAKLSPLDRAQTESMMKFRWTVAGGTNESFPFTKESIDEIRELTHGVPRAIIKLADLCLLNAAINKEKKITKNIVVKMWPEMLVEAV
jgi:general secretion pathway protein A